jgi:hypothetical protein
MNPVNHGPGKIDKAVPTNAAMLGTEHEPCGYPPKDRP